MSEKITLGITYLKISPEKNITYLIKGDSRVPETCIEKVTCLFKKKNEAVTRMKKYTEEILYLDKSTEKRQKKSRVRKMQEKCFPGDI